MEKEKKTMTPIKFGTDGWRAIIDHDFTPENVEKIIQAFCDLFCDCANKKIILGYDRRLKSPESAELVAEVLSRNGFAVSVSDQYCPTPCVSWMTKNSNALAGIVITASHNPSQWNGIKFKESYGGSASAEYTKKIEQKILENSDKKGTVQKKGVIAPFSPQKEYVAQLRSLVDVQLIQKAGWKILNDPLFGAGTHFLKETLEMEVEEIHTAADTTFGGLNPEPIDKNLGEMMLKMKSGRYDAGLATDGDADRIGAVDEGGNFVNSHQIFALLLQHYVENKKLKGPIIKSISATQMINILCKKYRLECIETPIGFKYICPLLKEKNALMGGEESGGISFAPHVHERDGILNGLFLLELMSIKKKRLGELIADLYAKIGSFYFDRYDLHVERPLIEALQSRLISSPLTEIGGEKIASVNRMDGFKYILEDGSWLLLRASGTEPLLRIYAEGSSPQKVKKLLSVGKSLF